MKLHEKVPFGPKSACRLNWTISEKAVGHRFLRKSITFITKFCVDTTSVLVGEMKFVMRQSFWHETITSIFDGKHNGTALERQFDHFLRCCIFMSNCSFPFRNYIFLPKSIFVEFHEKSWFRPKMQLYQRLLNWRSRLVPLCFSSKAGQFINACQIRVLVLQHDGPNFWRWMEWAGFQILHFHDLWFRNKLHEKWRLSRKKGFRLNSISFETVAFPAL